MRSRKYVNEGQNKYLAARESDFDVVKPDDIVQLQI